MERKVLVVCAVVGFLGIASAAMAFAAEATKLKQYDIYDPVTNECSLPKKNAAVGLAITSALLLLVAQMIVNAFNACFCCTRHPRASWMRWAIALITFILSWVAFIIAVIILLIGAYLNNQEADNFEMCAVIKPGAFSGAGASALATVCLGLISYVSLCPSNHTNPLGLQNEMIATGQPQIPDPTLQNEVIDPTLQKV